MPTQIQPRSIPLIQSRITIHSEALQKLDQIVESWRPYVFASLYQVRDQDGHWLRDEEKTCLLQTRPIRRLRTLSADFHTILSLTADDRSEYRFALGLSTATGQADGPTSYGILFAKSNLSRLRHLPCAQQWMQFIHDKKPLNEYLYSISEPQYFLEHFRRRFLAETDAAACQYFAPPSTSFFSSLEYRIVEFFLVDNETLLRLRLSGGTRTHVWDVNMSIVPVHVVEWKQYESPAFRENKQGQMQLLSRGEGAVRTQATPCSVATLVSKFPDIENRLLMTLIAASGLDSGLSIADLSKAVKSLIADENARAYYSEIPITEDMRYTYYSIGRGRGVYGNLVPAIKRDHDPLRATVEKGRVAPDFARTLLRLSKERLLDVQELEMKIHDLPFKKEVVLDSDFQKKVAKELATKMASSTPYPVALSALALSERQPFVYVAPDPDQVANEADDDPASLNRCTYNLQKMMSLAAGMVQQMSTVQNPIPGRHQSHQNLLAKKLTAAQYARDYALYRAGKKPDFSPLFSVGDTDLELPMNSRFSIVLPIQKSGSPYALIIITSRMEDFFCDFSVEIEVIDHDSRDTDATARRLADYWERAKPVDSDAQHVVLWDGSRHGAKRWLFEQSLHGQNQIVAAYLSERDETLYSKNGELINLEANSYGVIEDERQLCLMLTSVLPKAVMREDFKRTFFRPVRLEPTDLKDSWKPVILKNLLLQTNRHAAVLHVSHLPLGEPALLRLVAKFKQFITTSLVFSHDDVAVQHLQQLAKLIAELERTKPKSFEIQIAAMLRDLLPKKDQKLSEHPAYRSLLRYMKVNMPESAKLRFPIIIMG